MRQVYKSSVANSIHFHTCLMCVCVSVSGTYGLFTEQCGDAGHPELRVLCVLSFSRVSSIYFFFQEHAGRWIDFDFFPLTDGVDKCVTGIAYKVHSHLAPSVSEIAFYSSVMVCF